MKSSTIAISPQLCSHFKCMPYIDIMLLVRNAHNNIQIVISTISWYALPPNLLEVFIILAVVSSNETIWR